MGLFNLDKKTAWSNGLLFTKRQKWSLSCLSKSCFQSCTLNYPSIGIQEYIRTLNSALPVLRLSCPPPQDKQNPTVTGSAQVACLAPLGTLELWDIWQPSGSDVWPWVTVPMKWRLSRQTASQQVLGTSLRWSSLFPPSQFNKGPLV